jgi:protein TonB
VSAKRKKHSRLPVVIVGVCVVVVAGGAYALVRSFLSSPPGEPKKTVQEVHIIRPPPPPPDVPPPPPPPPEEEKVDVTEPEKPDPTPSNEPPPAQLGLDQEGGSGSDAFGLMAHKGGRDITAAGGSVYAWYGGVAQGELQSFLQDDPVLRKGAYEVPVQFWLRDDGSIVRFRLAQSSGNRERDKALEKRLAQFTRISQAPPAGTPWPMTLRVRNRG